MSNTKKNAGRNVKSTEYAIESIDICVGPRGGVESAICDGYDDMGDERVDFTARAYPSAQARDQVETAEDVIRRDRLQLTTCNEACGGKCYAERPTDGPELVIHFDPRRVERLLAESATINGIPVAKLNKVIERCNRIDAKNNPGKFEALVKSEAAKLGVDLTTLGCAMLAGTGWVSRIGA